MNTKVITFYLPQYHRTPENDKWWGEGFTEWTNVRKATPVFKGQVQPKIPYGNNYYDLTEKKVVEWQTDLMLKYGVYGFCYFHYWFNGKKVLYKPAENLLSWKDINQKYCFMWANCTWARTWSAVKNVTEWVKDDEKQDDNGILLEQKYGTEDDWKEHYRYLKQFFADERYIKIDGKPVFLVYYISHIECAKQMFEVWNNMAKADGFPGIYILSVNEDSKLEDVYGIVKYGNYYRYGRSKIARGVDKIARIARLKKNKSCVMNYDKVWKGLINEKYRSNKITYPGGVVTYDETPRRGINSTYLRGATPDKFGKYIREQIERRESQYLFLDAWNEWGEGNYLEPDLENEYGYLQALKKALLNDK